MVVAQEEVKETVTISKISPLIKAGKVRPDLKGSENSLLGSVDTMMCLFF